MNTELFINTKCIATEFCHSVLKIAISSYSIHMNYCLDVSTCVYYELTN